jgi:hypothetical protein
MRNQTKLAIAWCLLAFTAASGFSQDAGAKAAAEQPKYFRLDFVVKELDAGKVTNSRNYSMTISTGETMTSVIRAGSKIPITTGGGAESTGLTYIDVGVNIDCRAAKEIQGDLALNISAEISSAATTSPPPLIRQTKWSANVIVPLRKSTLVFSSDDAATKGQMQLELTATPIK